MELYGHRGYSAKYPENTMAAFKAVLPYAQGIEFDVQLSRDDEIVIIHDETLDRTTSGKGLVKDEDYNSINSLSIRGGDKDQYVPRLVDVLEWARGLEDFTLNIELKTDFIPYEGIAEKTYRLVEAYGLVNQTVFSSFNLQTLEELREAAPDARIGILIHHSIPRLKQWVKELDAEAIHCPPDFPFTEEAQMLRLHGTKLRVYTVDDTETMKELDGKVDVIMTDDVETLRHAIERE
ncbi:glycerophosphodiester phosphodiesterase family protein [Bacillus testis]|uniref:glycerophosphodiester phosphodiesterase family protein n=1 Tax=Bacillus testis TaxID=1622072 RepID=UPI00067F08C0|nr:glycerophosphodiester phosphodiesterase family protein [Bacillus testis]